MKWSLSEGVGRNRKQIDVKHLPTLLLTVLVGCASAPLTEEQIEEREYYEQERVLAYLQWKTQCLAYDGLIFAYKPWKPCRGGDCIPSKREWRYDFDRERPMFGNSYTCVSRTRMREIMSNL